jgi:NAD(P)H-dependent FMN reductase
VEWNEKAIGFLSYGAGAGGSRSVEHLKQVVSWLRMAPVPNALHVVHYYKQKMADVQSAQGEELTSILDDLARWGDAMRTLRETNPRT